MVFASGRDVMLKQAAALLVLGLTIDKKVT